MNLKIKILTTGGTIDKVYFDQKSTFAVGESTVGEILKEANVTFEFESESIMRKDSLDMTDEDRQIILEKIKTESCRHIILTHGTDTMIETAKKLLAVSEKVIVLTGSMSPARFRSSDAFFNFGGAVAAVQILPPGVYIAMNGLIFDPQRARKNREENRFEEI